MKFSVYQISRQGGRERNEDRMGYAYTRESGLFVLADGMGGHPEGAMAAQLALLSHADKGDAGNQVRLMSMHASKGLEFRYVFIVGVEDGNLPHDASLDEGRIDEERRLLYVGITRAKERLWLSHSRETQRWGEKIRLKPSRFLDELPAEELQRDGADPALDAEHKKERAKAGFDAIRALLES
mgnify:CR=1 FL=1